MQTYNLQDHLIADVHLYVDFDVSGTIFSVAALNALLSARADPNARAAPDGCTPALIAAQQNHAGCLDALAARGADLDAPYLTGHQSTPFIMSAHNDAADKAPGAQWMGVAR